MAVAEALSNRVDATDRRAIGAGAKAAVVVMRAATRRSFMVDI
jgi:hypothetical protein